MAAQALALSDGAALTLAAVLTIALRVATVALDLRLPAWQASQQP